MDATAAERLKREWTGKRVTVEPSVVALRRFAGRAGTVLTVNMNGRLLVRFDGPADIGWYDISPDDVYPVAVPIPPEEQAPPPPGQPPVTSATHPQPETTAGGSPPTAGAATARPKSILELARQQGAAKPKG